MLTSRTGGQASFVMQRFRICTCTGNYSSFLWISLPAITYTRRR
ncbi:unnamed protein product, partial [Amoebophrya sp. A120]|eukprot:GSA120T00012247001.1